MNGLDGLGTDHVHQCFGWPWRKVERESQPKLAHGVAVVRRRGHRWEVFYFSKHGAEFRCFDEHSLAIEFAEGLTESEKDLG